jgi:uncharacterized repeat protein (TIGR03803 family)
MQPKAITTNLRVCAFALAMLAMGTIFLSAQTFSVLYSFNGANVGSSDGSNPYAGLILSGNTLYGTTFAGGSSSYGTVFSVNTDGTGYTILHNFAWNSDGALLPCPLVLSGNKLYGTTLENGGSSSYGTIFSINTNGTNFTTLYSFADGFTEQGLILSGNILYGAIDGRLGGGAVFSINSDGADFTTLHNLAGAPVGSLILSGNKLYGTSTGDGSAGYGTVFSVNTDGTSFTTLYNFTGDSDGADPIGNLILSDNILYGTTYGTAYNGRQHGSSTVFKMRTDGTGFTTVHSFTATSPASNSNPTNSDGAALQAGLILLGNTLYGTASAGGISGGGTVFSVNTDGANFTILHSFSATSSGFYTNSDGGEPTCTLLFSGNKLYGTASFGGSSGSGTVFTLSLAPSAPVITTQPQSQAAPNGSNVTFSVVASGFPAPNYQWLFGGQIIPTATNATFTLQANVLTAQSSGGYSVIVSNPYGSVTSATASLAVLADGANGIQPNQLFVSAAPTQSSGVNNLVLITHGWEPLGPLADVSWITDMANAIQAKAPNWSVMPYNWMRAAWFPDPDLTLVSGAALGTLYAKLRLEPQHWQHIHFIAHSAGSAVIEAMAKELRSSPNPPLTIEETFLDPYTGFTSLTGRGVYGANADWADNYSALGSFVDFAPSIIGLGNATVGKLDNAYNTDVGWVDPNHWTVPYGSGQIALASHEWPHNFYMESITNTDPGWIAHGYGFPLSMEGGGGNNNLVNYPEGLDPFAIGGPLNALQSPFQQQSFTQLVLDGLAHAVSDVGAGLVGSAGFVLNNIPVLPLVKSGGIHPLGGPVPQGGSSSSTPAWLAVGVTITNPVNLVQFDAGFTDTNAAEGLLTVYWNTNQIGLVDERAASSNLQTYRFALPSTVTNGIYTLSFRLDSFDSTSSSIAVTNVATGFVGVTQPITLGISFTNGVPLVQLTAATNFTYLVQCSTNLVDWTPTALLVNTNGTILFPDATATNSGTRFYRAIMP